MPTERITTTEVIHKYVWPEAQLTFWWNVMWYFFTFQLGVFAAFMSVQTQMGLGQPWLFSYSVTVGTLGTFFLIVIQVLRNTNKLLPNVIMVGNFILFVLVLTAIIESGIMMFGPSGVNSQCSASSLAADGVTATTLAYIAQMTISWQVSNDNYE